MAGLLYICPSCNSESSVPDEYVGQTVQCAHCEQLFVATAPIFTVDARNQITTSERTRIAETQPPRFHNPAEDEPLPPTQDTYKQAKTVREILIALSEVTAAGEVQLSNEEGTFEPSHLLTLLPRDSLKARIIGSGADEFGEYVKTEASDNQCYFQFVWSATRQGWACNWPGAGTLHYFIPKSAMHEPPYCGDRMLVALCKRSFHAADHPMHRNYEAKRCTICLEKRGKMLGYDGPKRPKKKVVRITLSKAQTETNAGRHLLQLISRVADDRLLTPEELHQFRESLNDPELQEFSATHWLKENLDGVLADGYVTREEYYSVVSSILRVLPPDVRSDWENRMRSGDRPATDKQVDYIRGLGGGVTEGTSVKQASAIIDSLLKARGEISGDQEYPKLAKSFLFAQQSLRPGGFTRCARPHGG